MNRYRHPRTSIPEQAAEWLLELADPGLGEERRRQFMSWLKRSPQHIEEFLAIAVLEQEIGEQPVPLAEILGELQRAGPSPPEPLFAALAAAPAVAPPQGRGRRLISWAAAAGVVAATVLLTQFAVVDDPPVRHTTELGEQRSVALGDGTIVTLNTLSEVDIRIGRSMRHVALLAGEAMFDVATDAKRPFVVDAGTVSLTVLGTKFSVYRKGNVTRLAVVEGAVQVVPDDPLTAPLVVEAGEGLVARREGITPIAAGLEFEMAVAWTDRRLIFNGAPLAEVVNEFNRYNAVPIVVEDSELASREVTTVFKANDVRALVTFLEMEPDVEVQHDDDAIRIRAKH